MRVCSVVCARCPPPAHLREGEGALNFDPAVHLRDVRANLVHLICRSTKQQPGGESGQ